MDLHIPKFENSNGYNSINVLDAKQFIQFPEDIKT